MQLGKVKLNPTNGIILGKAPMKELRAMTRLEVLKLLSEARTANHPWYSVWRVTYELGLRAGETYALKFSDIDFSAGFVRIQRSYETKTKAYKAPKNKTFRSVPLNESLKKFIVELKEAAGNREFVFERDTTWEHGEQAKVLREFQQQVGIEPTNFHSLRASFITHLLLAGVPLLKVKEMVGHRRTETTERYMRMVAADTIGATSVLELKES